MQELVSAPEIVPVRGDKLGIAAVLVIIAHSDEEQWRGVGRSPRIRVTGEPGNLFGRLRDLVRNAAVFALHASQELKRRFCIREVTNTVEGEGSPFGIASEEPRESRTGAGARCSVAGNKSGAKERICHHALQSAHT